MAVGVTISELSAATTPLDGTEVVEIEQSSNSRKVTVANLITGGSVFSLSNVDPDPDADAIAFWDDSDDAVEWITTIPDSFITESSVTQHEAAIDHDALTNFVGNEHIDWTSTSSNFSTSGTLGAGAATITSVAIGGGQTISDSDNLPILSGSQSVNVFTNSDPVRFSATNPNVRFYATGGASDEKMWGEQAANSAFFRFTTRTDADTFGEEWLRVTRSGTSVTTANFPNGTLQYGGVEVETVSSTKRLKKNIVESNVGLDAILSLRPVHFDWNPAVLDRVEPHEDPRGWAGRFVRSSTLVRKEADGRRVGLIAEEVAEILPEVVERGADGQIIRFSPVLMDGVLVKAIQELHAEVQELRAKI